MWTNIYRYTYINPHISLYTIYDFNGTTTGAIVGDDGLAPWDPKLAGSNPAEVDRFLAVKVLSTSPRGEILSCESHVWTFSGLFKEIPALKIGFWAVTPIDKY